MQVTNTTNTATKKNVADHKQVSQSEGANPFGYAVSTSSVQKLKTRRRRNLGQPQLKQEAEAPKDNKLTEESGILTNERVAAFCISMGNSTVASRHSKGVASSMTRSTGSCASKGTKDEERDSSVESPTNIRNQTNELCQVTD